MEKPNRNLNVPDSDVEATIIMDDDASAADTDDLIATLPLKPQDRYKFIRSIGFGGMKGVLLVHDRDTGRDVAMAIMPEKMAARKRSGIIPSKFTLPSTIRSMASPRTMGMYSVKKTTAADMSSERRNSAR